MGRKRRGKKDKRNKKHKRSRKIVWLEDDIVVWSDRKVKRCWKCNEPFEGRRSLVVFNGKKKRSRATCLRCAGLDAFGFLPAGSSKLTRRASKYSSQRAVVVRRRGKFTQRFGILVEREAIVEACDECEVDIPAGAFEPIGGTKTVLPPTGAQPAAGRSRTKKPKTAAKPTPKKQRKKKRKSRRSAAKTPLTGRSMPEPATDKQTYRDRLARAIREAFPDCSPRLADQVADFAINGEGLQFAPPNLDDLGPETVGPMVSRYLRRRALRRRK